MSAGILPVDREPELPPEAGGKARGLQLIARAGLPFPPTWVVTPTASESSVLGLAECLRSTSHSLLAVRSSAEEEDSQQASFAGIHESRIGVPVDELPRVVADIAASTLSERALAYRNQLGLPAPIGRCAVLVQPLVSSACAGIAFGAGEAGDRVVIEAVEGFGEYAVRGDARPERQVLALESGRWQVQRREPRLQLVALHLRENRLVPVPLADDRRHGPLLDSGPAVAIARGVERLQRMAGGPLDVEWALSGDHLWFLQARARTRPLGEDLPPREIWSRANVRDVLPEIPTAFTRSTIATPIDEGVRAHLGEYGVRIPADIPLFAFVHGRPVFNERTLVVGDMLGASRASMQVDFGGASAPDDRVLPMKLGTALRHPRLLFRALRLPAEAESRAQVFLDEAKALRRRLESIPLAAATASDLLESIRADSPALSRRFALTGMRVVGALTNAQYPALWRLRHHPSPRALIARLIADGESTTSTQQIDDLVLVADLLRPWAGAVELLTSTIREDTPVTRWREPVPEPAGGALAGWLSRYGHRGPYESDLASPRYVEDLRLVARLLLPLVASSGVAPAQSPARRREAAGRAWEEVEALVGARGRRRTEEDLRRMKRLAWLREEVRSETCATMLVFRRMVQTLGARLAQQGSLRNADDVWHLSIQEISRAFAKPGFGADFAVARELARRAAWRRIDVPNRFASEDVLRMGLGLDSRPGSSSYAGNGISPGSAEGPVRVLLTPDEGERLGVGEILVAPATDPGWTPLFARASAIVVEIGGSLSHAGIVAREFAIPCVANIDGITRQLRDGDVVRVDGTSGLVTVVSPITPVTPP